MDLKRFNTIGTDELQAVEDCILQSANRPERWPLSGYLGGELRSKALYVPRLEEEWAGTFGVKHAIATNSATSGLLLACMAAGVGRESAVVVPAYTMSATAAAPAFLGANIHFGDIDDDTFCLRNFSLWGANVVIPVNLFGHPASLAEIRKEADKIGAVMIEDNAQAIFATEGGKYAGTVGHIGVFSGNVHKHLQCGEGGICVTDDDGLASRMRRGLNHGELAGGPPGLNLRMTEVTAAIFLEQLRKGPQIVAERREIAETIIDAAKPLLTPPVVRENCTHSYYMIPWQVERSRWVAQALQAEGVPVKAGYTTPLYDLNAFKSEPLWTTEHVEADMLCYENCAWSPTSAQLKQFKEAFKKVGDRYDVSRGDAGVGSGDGREVACGPERDWERKMET